MGIKRILAVKNRRKKIVRVVLWLALAGTIVFFVNQRKDFLAQEARRSFEAMISRESDLEVHIGRVSGRFSGEVRFEKVRLLEQCYLPEEDRLLFEADSVGVHYRLLDFFSKKFDSKITVSVDKPRVFWRSRVRLAHENGFPFMRWMRDWAISQKNNLNLQVRDLEIIAPYPKFAVGGIDLSYEENRLNVEIPLRHLAIGTMDVSTVLKAQGQFRLGLFGAEDMIEGEIRTEGSVVNWSPLPEESGFRFRFSRSGFQLLPSTVLGGIEIEGGVDFKNDDDAHWALRAKDYPLSNLDFLLKSSPSALLPSHVDVELEFDGSLLAPSVHGRARIYKGYIGKKTYKAMDLNISGVYPTVRLENSRVLLSDDSVMKFADKTLEFSELFKDKTYQSLVGAAQQDMVLWGDWELRRPKNMNDRPEFVLERLFGEHARLNLHEYRQEDTIQQDPEAEKLALGVEYRLQGKDTLKFQLREDEKFVGVERKMKF